MTREESNEVCEKIHHLRTEGRWLEAQEYVWQIIQAVQITPEQEEVLRAVRIARKEYAFFMRYGGLLGGLWELDETLEQAGKEDE